jgi:hypothetical protein
MLVGAAFCVVGAVICQKWAPETAGRRLVETSGSPGRCPARAATATEAVT